MWNYISIGLVVVASLWLIFVGIRAAVLSLKEKQLNAMYAKHQDAIAFLTVEGRVVDGSYRSAFLLESKRSFKPLTLVLESKLREEETFLEGWKKNLIRFLGNSTMYFPKGKIVVFTQKYFKTQTGALDIEGDIFDADLVGTLVSLEEIGSFLVFEENNDDDLREMVQKML